ncbi:MAG: GNAT family N-acetyltransferase [Candidatus Nomurabacteria bacterium]|nr:GNAT family N-acetyltransferase [Candidatus Nomurabacteria bacterium]
MNYRNATEDDIEKIWELGENVSGFVTSDDVVTFWPKAILENSIDKPDVLIKVAETDGEIVGFVIVNINRSLKKAEIENIFVSENYRRQGVASELIKSAIAELKNGGIENVVAMSNEAVDLLVSLGFSKGRQFYWMDLVFGDEFRKVENE